MNIKRSKRPERNFTMLPNELINDANLSWEARGVLIFILSKPDSWVVRTSHLIKQTEGSRKQSKRDSIRAILNELETVGYIRKTLRRSGKGGRIEGYDYIVYETPSSNGNIDTDNNSLEDSSPEPDFPAPDQPSPDQPSPDNPPLVSTEGLERTDEVKRTDNSVIAQGANATLMHDGVSASVVQAPKVPIPDDMPGPKDPNTKTFRTWANYAMAFKRRYHEWPIWNRRVAGQIKNVIDRVGAELAPKVAAWYVCTNSHSYVNSGHSVGQLLLNCETLAVQYKTGRQITSAASRQADATQSNLNIVDELDAMIDAAHGEH